MTLVDTHSVSVNIPITASDETFANGKLHGSGDRAIVFSNMDTNDQIEWDPVIEDLVTERCMVL